jgi:hypothetical protein
MNPTTKAGLNAGAPITQTDDRGSVRREAPAGIEPANSGFAEPSPGGDVTRDGRDTQQTDTAGSAVGGGAGAPAGDGMPGSMPGDGDALRDAVELLRSMAREHSPTSISARASRAANAVERLLADRNAVTIDELLKAIRAAHERLRIATWPCDCLYCTRARREA